MNKDKPVVSALSCVVIAIIFAIGLLQLAKRLKEVQIDAAANYNYASSAQSMRRVQTAGIRGRILDRNGKILAGNRTALTIACDPVCFQARTWEATATAISNAIERVGAAMGLDFPLTEKAIKRHIDQSLAMPLVVWRDIGNREVAIFSEHEAEFMGFRIMETAERVYPEGSLASHIIGFVGRAEASSEAGDERFAFRNQELFGREGLERYYDGFLRGMPGEVKLLVDARGFAIDEQTVVEADKGPDLQLALDAELQRVVEAQLKGEKGACVVMNPQNGEVLAMASAPAYDLRACVPILRSSEYRKLMDDPDRPMFNRASGGAYAPGSTFKPICALAGLREGYLEDTEYSCDGAFRLGSMALRCTAYWGHGPIDMRHAMMKSCNPYFCNLGMEIGSNAVITAAREFGLGAKTGIDLAVDMAGVVPDGEWKRKMYKEQWYPGDLAQMSIGQGMLLASPLQMACVAGAIGTGYLVTPHLKKEAPFERKALPFSQAQLNIVREGMRMVVKGDGETRGSGSLGGEGVEVEVAGKTGTAEVGQGKNRRKNTWFIAYAPVEKPSVAIAMVIENGESGGRTTAPRVGAILRAIFNGHER